MIMATLNFSVRYNMETAAVWLGTVTAHDKSSLTLELLLSKAVYSGSLNYRNGSSLPSSGSVSGIKLYENNTLQYELSGGKLSISKILGFLNNADSAGLQQYQLAGNDTINGSLEADVLLGWAGNDVLNGGKGADTMKGGKGNDTYAVDNIGDVIVELANEGTDTVESSESYSLNDNVENLTLIGTAANATGNALKNKLIGNDGDNVLDGLGDRDTLIGSKGNDLYRVDLIKSGSSAKLQDKISEKANEGSDSIELRVAGDLALSKAATLKLGANFENLDASGTGSNLINLTGNSLDNHLTGNAAANILDGGKGADILIGGDGDDTYIIDDIIDPTDLSKDVIVEDASAGIDLVKLNVAIAGGSYTLDDNIDNATLISKVAFDITGNTLDNVINGNAKNNVIWGGEGADTLDGGAGVDTVSYAGSSDGVTVTLNGKTPTNGSGGDAKGDILVNFENIIGSASDDTLTGDAKDNRLDGGKGVDILTGGDGNDTYVVDNADDIIVEGNSKTSGNNDTVEAWFGYTLGDNIENLTLSNDAAISDKNFNGTGNALNNTIIGNDGNNTLNGGDGKDTLKGGKGDDTYIAYLTKSGTSISLQDSFVENAGEGNDTLQIHAVGDLGLASTATLKLDANIEILDASDTGSNKLNLTGNSVDNTLIGNAADNILDGGTGIDILKGGVGNDTYIVDNTADTITEQDGEGIDLVKVDIASTGSTFTLGNYLENAIAISNLDVNLIGNDLSNTLTGNSKNNVIEGIKGSNKGNADILDGGAGVDTVSYEHAALGTALGSDANGHDLGHDSGVSVTLNGSTFTTAHGGDAEGDQLKNFENVTGSANNDTLVGDTNANILDGGAGNDRMEGGNGNDTYIVDSSLDVVTETDALAAGGIDLVQSYVDFTLGSNVENLNLIGLAVNGTGNDLDNILIGNTLGNTLEGGAGNDTLDGGAGIDTLIGGKGNDTYYVDLTVSPSQVVFEDTMTENKDEGTDTLIVFYEARNETGPASALLTLVDNLENMDISGANLTGLNLKGNSSNNVLTGNKYANAIDGGVGDDILKGGDGADILLGGDGADILTGGSGLDTLTGGLGTDIFNFDAASTGNADDITDFSRFQGDSITLLQSQFKNAGTAGKKLAATEFYSGASPSATATQHILYDTSNGKLYYNEDGTGSGALVLIAVFDNKASLLSTDISFI